ncbi:CsbD family protein [Streptococcus pseudoporcinus]|uniref:CsbD-like protein n=1 Tax=Streptococcus pseudoporcinus TaxID=361101 RepID=A0A4U9Y9J7_9STRE|nr:CsbD family protein [Streptococcus pseudoporcinus]VTS21971.1 CsbD-like protein [Streptococcus pseudoporcinus]VUC70144.1 CsbD-like protein [Streptococcus pseudoporcinus]VUD00202.1 CsbD-like protein [Streptococcus pseudoporcinus]VUD00594.1 CsbD-like protein [Streptococcus pseudoporcinus]
MTKEKVDSKFEEVKGRAKEVAGKVLGDKKLEVEGLVEKEIEKIKQKFEK